MMMITPDGCLPFSRPTSIHSAHDVGLFHKADRSVNVNVTLGNVRAAWIHVNDWRNSQARNKKKTESHINVYLLCNLEIVHSGRGDKGKKKPKNLLKNPSLFFFFLQPADPWQVFVVRRCWQSNIPISAAMNAANGDICQENRSYRSPIVSKLIRFIVRRRLLIINEYIKYSI